MNLGDYLTLEDKVKLNNIFSKSDKKQIEILKKYGWSPVKYERIMNKTKNKRIYNKNRRKACVIKKAQRIIYNRVASGMDYMYEKYLDTMLEDQFSKFTHVKDIEYGERISFKTNV